MPDRFESFDLSIQRIGERYQARVTGSPAGPRPPVEIDPAGLEFESPAAGNDAPTARDVRRHPVGRKDLRRIGERLFRAVFIQTVGEAFRASLERVRSERLGLRIRLHLEEVPELATLPWEALWDPTDRAFLADRPDLPIVRALGPVDPSPASQAVPRPLRVLALLPEPRGEGKLGGEKEWGQIGEQLQALVDQGAARLDRLRPPTLDALGQRIASEACHVLHVVAHGGPGGSGAGGVLKLEDTTGGLDRVTGGDLARALGRRTPPRLVVLSACHGARAAVDDAFDGMAQHLSSQGVTAVVAMRTSISDDAAVAFAVALYQQLAAGRTIETAMIEARRGLSLGERRNEWATPVLYLRGEDVRIFEVTEVGGTEKIAAGNGIQARWRWHRAIAAFAAILLAGGLSWHFGGRSSSTEAAAKANPCPAPLGLQDLEFVPIEPDLIVLDDREIVVASPFCIATKEVSRRDWRTVMGEEPSNDDWSMDWPMTHVTPDDVERFLANLEVRDPGRDYRLPTDLEWEFAARAGNTTKYFFGDDAAQLDQYGNCKNITGRDCADGPAPVGSYQPNPWGLYDVHGNVAEWVVETLEAPIDEDLEDQALRLGGSFDSALRNCAFLDPDSRRRVVARIKNRQDTGFRVACEIRDPEEVSD
ncbi:MAG: CHAT domain-containing protein [Acidobacteriota bacterium]